CSTCAAMRSGSASPPGRALNGARGALAVCYDRTRDTEGPKVQTPEKTRPRLFLIDGYALIYRAFLAMIQRPLLTTKGENTSAAFGFTRFLMKVRDDFQPDYLGVVLDAGNSKRTEIYPEYKATRDKMPTDLEWSLPKIRDIIGAFNVPVITLPD